MKIVRIWEGLGSQMFQYAFAKSLIKRNPDNVFIDINSSYRRYLRKKESDILRPYMLDDFNVSIPTIEVEKLDEWKFIRQSNIFEKIQFKKSVNLKYRYQFITDSYDVTEYNPSYYYTYPDVYYMGWYQNENYFKNYREELLGDFTLKKNICVPDIFSEFNNTVSIHVRRGDFVKGGWCLDSDYYTEAIKIIKKQINNPTFVVFTDDIEYAKTIFSSESCYYICDFGSYSASEELILMSKCKNNIIANSTFSWWGAWLNTNENKKVISPKHWTPRQMNINCEEWILI